jgi:hypothetical protein
MNRAGTCSQQRRACRHSEHPKRLVMNMTGSPSVPGAHLNVPKLAGSVPEVLRLKYRRAAPGGDLPGYRAAFADGTAALRESRTRSDRARYWHRFRVAVTVAC